MGVLFRDNEEIANDFCGVGSQVHLVVDYDAAKGSMPGVRVELHSSTRSKAVEIIINMLFIL